MPTATDRVFRRDDPNPAAWAEFLTARDSGERFECDEAMAYYWLEVLPPVLFHQHVMLDGKPRAVWFGFAEGAELITVYWIERTLEGKRYFGQRTSILNPG